MTKTLIVSFLPRTGSNTAKIVEAFKTAAEGKTEIIERKLDDSTIPMINKIHLETFWSPKIDNEFESNSAQFVKELKEADNVVIAAPIYNFGMPAPVKAWVDLVARAGETFQYTQTGPEGLLQATNGAVLMTTGGLPIGSDIDFMSPNLKTVMGFMGIGNTTIVGASGLSGISESEVNKRIATASEEAVALVGAWFN